MRTKLSHQPDAKKRRFLLSFAALRRRFGISSNLLIINLTWMPKPCPYPEPLSF